MRALKSLAIFAAVAVSSAAHAQTVDWKKIDEVLGRTAAVTQDVHRYGFPRSDLQVTLDGVAIKPGLALGGWTAFKPAHDGVMVMGDLVLLETEINPVMSKMIDNGLDACEAAGVRPAVSVAVSRDHFAVADAGRGIPREVVESALDFSTRTSSNSIPSRPPR